MATLTLDDKLKTSLKNYCKIPGEKDIVWKDECLYCFDNPMCSQNEFFICLSSWIGFCKNHLDYSLKENDVNFYLTVKRTKIPMEPVPKKPTKLAIGIEGGFDDYQKAQFSDKYFLAAIGRFSGVQYIKYEESDLPEDVAKCFNAVKIKVGSILNSIAASWDGELRLITKYSHSLVQVENPPIISNTGWKCSECEKTDNLWLNLSDGIILCGRKYHDGSGGNNHAELHYKNSRYPLVVKLGTIGINTADVFSYEEDQMVDDLELDKHLSHFGIDRKKFNKTEKTISEMEVEMNLNIEKEWETIQEKGKDLEPLYGSGYTGIINMGNTCYIASLLQVLFSFPEIKEQFDYSARNTRSRPHELIMDIYFHLCKFCYGIYSGRYSENPLNDTILNERGIRPLMLKHSLCHDHPEFKSFHQQDVAEFFLHLCQKLETYQSKTGTHTNIDSYFTFETMTYFMLKNQAGNVMTKKNTEKIFQIPVPVDEATNFKEYQQYMANKSNPSINSTEVVRLRIPYEKCIERYRQESEIGQLTIKGITGPGLYISRLQSLPEYLILQVCKYTIDPVTFLPKKLDVLIPFPDELDLSNLLEKPDFKGASLQNMEDSLYNTSSPLIKSLLVMGYSFEVSQRAAKETNYAGIEQAINWLCDNTNIDFENRTADINNQDISENNVDTLTSMGYSRELAIEALISANQNLELAADYLLTKKEELLSAIKRKKIKSDNISAKGANINQSKNHAHTDSKKYSLVGFISHMGSSTTNGHYVCHILKEDKWVICNDENIAISQNPPKDMGYLYFYRKK